MAIAILAAMSSELAPFLAGLDECLPRAGFQGRLISFHTGTHAGRPLVAVRTGVGKVNAALAAQLLIDHFAIDAIIQVGLAGAIDLDLSIGDIILGDRYIQHDVDLTQTGLGLSHGEILFDLPNDGRGFAVDPSMHIAGFDADADLLALAAAAGGNVAPPPRLIKGTIVSGDQFIRSPEKRAWLRDTYHATAVEMEAAAVAQVCCLNGIPFLGIRTISDRADGSAHMELAAALPVAAHRYHQIVVGMLDAWHRIHP